MRNPPIVFTIAAVGVATLVARAQSSFVLNWGGILEAAPPGPFRDMSGGINCSIGLRPNGIPVAWGDLKGGMGSIPAGSYKKVVCGKANRWAAGIRDDGTIVVWGQQLDPSMFQPPAGAFVDIALAGVSGLARRADGTLAAWGVDGILINNVPAGAFTAIAAGTGHFLALRADGSIAAWGSNQFGQLSIPPGVYSAIAAGNEHTLALRQDGSIVALGLSNQGQLNVPPGLYSAIATNWRTNVAIRLDGTLAAWGQSALVTQSIPPGIFRRISVGHTHALAMYGCYGDCDASTTSPTLTVNDFICFLNKFAAGDTYANCDGSAVPPVLNVNDFICYINVFAAGCS